MFFTSLFLLLLLMNTSFANDLGIYSEVYPIKEVNFKKLIAEELERLDAQSINKKLIKNAKNFSENLKPNQLPTATKTETVYHDPSVVLSKSIMIRGEILYKKGTRINPLKIIRPSTNLLFFNGNDREQLEFALQSLKKNPYRLTLVMTQGNPAKLANTIHRPIYYATSGIVDRFKIEKVPSLLGVGKDEHENYLAVTMMNAPYSTQVIQDCWNGCTKK